MMWHSADALFVRASQRFSFPLIGQPNRCDFTERQIERAITTKPGDAVAGRRKRYSNGFFDADFLALLCDDFEWPKRLRMFECTNLIDTHR